MEAENIQSCNCDYGCPCNFNGYPSHGFCEALVGFRIRKGTFGKTKLDGVKFALGAKWPKAIHEGNGTGRYYIDPSATEEQRNAMEAIFSGKNGGAVFTVFPTTWTKHLPTKVTKIEWNYEGHDSWFRVDGIGEVRSGHITNPVTGEEFEGAIDLPHGLAWKRAEVTAIRKLDVHDGELTFHHENGAGFFTVFKMTEKGLVG